MSPYYILLAILFYLAKSVLSDAESYKGYVVLNITPRNETQMNFLASLDDPEYDFLNEPYGLGTSANLVVPPRLLKGLTESFKEHRMEYYVKVPDLQKFIVDHIRERRKRSTATFKYEDFFNHFYNIDGISNFTKELRVRYSSFVTLETIGHSYEGRTMTIIKISTNKEANKPIIWIDSAIHAREWATIPTSLYIAYQLLENYKNSNEPQIAELLDHFDWYILPVFNPDGYHYSRTKSIMWRKNRRPVTDRYGYKGIGIDLNRNFPFEWDGSGGYMQSAVNSESFAGIKPLSEKELIVVVDYLSSIAKRLSAAVTIHSFANMWLHPWGYTGELPKDFDEIKRAAKEAVNGIKSATSQVYKDISPFVAFHKVGGSSVDWTYGTLGVIYSYAIELREVGNTMFFPPESAIPSLIEEGWSGVKAMALYIKKKHGEN